uniref:Eco57I restriction-modification methylase domain-containing protein n=1 Tax=Aliarcobacter cryaerophilus TaxID=28198 RepID=UPI00112F5334
QTKDNLQEYKNWLLNLKILDPACGSGAFLNQALEYLISEHKNLQNDLALMGDLFASYMVEEEILENNLYGVDINEDAVEIAKLSLWLRTAKRGRALTKLADKIVCANSLLNMPFSENSFDVVIGNPPYGATLNSEDKKKISKNYVEIYKGKYDSYHFFTYLGIKLLKINGIIGYIIPDTWTILQQTEKLREFILKYYIESIEKYNFQVFEDANIDTLTIIIRNKNEFNSKIKVNFVDKNYHKESKIISQERFLNAENFVFNYSISDINLKIIEKIKKDKHQIKDFCEWSQGLVPYSRETQDEETVSNRLFHSDSKINDTFKKEIDGKNISKYELEWNGKSWIQYGKWLHRPREQKFFINPRILVQRIRNPKLKIRIVATFTEKEYYNNPALSNFLSLNNDINELKYILALLNSNMMNWLYRNSFNDVNIKPTDLELLPIPKIDEESQKPFINLVDEILEAKQKIKDYKPLLDEAIKNNNFDREIALKKELENLENICSTNEKTIDQMVYKLYDLTPDEIKIVEGV